MPESPELEQSAPRGRVSTTRSPPVSPSPLSFGDGVARKGAQEDTSEPGMGHGSQCLHVCKRLVLCKKKKKGRNTVAWREPTQCSVPRVLRWAALGQRTTLRSDLKPAAQPSTTHPFSGQLMGGPSHRKTGWDRQASLGDSHTAPQPLTPNTHREQCWRGPQSPPTWRLL